MFEQFKAMGAIAGLMKDKDRLREVGQKFREKVDRVSVVGSAGGGAVRITVSGKLRATEVFLDPALVAGLQTGEGGRAMAQSLILEAMNDALSRAQSLIHEEAERQARELGLPSLPGFDSILGG